MMLRLFFIGVLLVSISASCSSLARSIPGQGEEPGSLSTGTPELSSTTVPLSERPGDIQYASVAEALVDLKARKGVSVEVLQGWTIIAEPDGSTTWSFAPSDHPAFPAVAKRVLYRDQYGWNLKMEVLCEAETAACNAFVKYFEQLNEPIYQMIDQQQEP